MSDEIRLDDLPPDAIQEAASGLDQWAAAFEHALDQGHDQVLLEITPQHPRLFRALAGTLRRFAQEDD